MNSFWSLETVKSALGGTWLARPEVHSRTPLGGASIDTRTIKPGEIFFAFRGEHVDGHTFVETAIEKGAGLIVIDRPESLSANLLKRIATTHAVVQVPDTGSALLKAGAAYRKTLENTKVIAVGGSNGKTTTTRIIHQVLASALRGAASPKSFNNSIGVPLTILQARPTDQFLLCEIGTNSPGEIAALAEVLQPDIAVITSIGREHLELLGSIEGVAREEASLLQSLRPQGCAILNAEAPCLADAAKRALSDSRAKNHTVITFGTGPSADLRLTQVTPSIDGLALTLNGNIEIKVPLLGEHNALNTAAAFAVGRRMGLSHEQITVALATVRGPEMRMELNHLSLGAQPLTIINDAYNANPDSMAAGLNAFAQLTRNSNRRRVIVLGNMLELGEDAPAMHAEVGELLCSLTCVDLLVCVGGLMQHAAMIAERCLPAAEVVRFDALTPAIAGDISAMFKPNDIIFLKGSRGMGLERVLNCAKDRCDSPHIVSGVRGKTAV